MTIVLLRIAVGLTIVALIAASAWLVRRDEALEGEES
jgi:hypothetical protein